MKLSNFKLGEKTYNVWAGDFVSECEFIANLEHGNMLFWDCRAKCFRRVWISIDENGQPYLHGWTTGFHPSSVL